MISSGITVIKNYLCLGGRSVIYILDNAGQAVRTIEIDQVGFIWYLHPGPPDIIYYTSFDCNEVGCVELDGSICFSEVGNIDIFVMLNMYCVSVFKLFNSRKNYRLVACASG
jgi:hypothetical protein